LATWAGGLGSFENNEEPTLQFPVAAFDTFAKQSIPRWTTNDAAVQAGYDAYVEKACPCVILVHSRGGNFAFNSALKYPDKVKAIGAVKTSGSGSSHHRFRSTQGHSDAVGVG
jgi:pimeloyl-ACP methyl ester carboxylesterase